MKKQKEELEAAIAEYETFFCTSFDWQSIRQFMNLLYLL